MRIRTDDAATRVEFAFYDLPGEARWFQWVRFYVACVIGVPLISFVLWSLGSLVASGPWLVIGATLAGAAITVITVVATLTITGRYETPTTPLTYRLRQLRAELAAPRTPRPVAGSPLVLPTWDAADIAAAVHDPTMFGAPCDFPEHDRAERADRDS